MNSFSYPGNNFSPEPDSDIQRIFNLDLSPAPPLFTGFDLSIGDIDSSCLLDTDTRKPILPVTMDIKISKFRGLSSEDASKFMQDFESLATLHGIDEPDSDHRKVAAFHLYLEGPALQWYNTLTSLDKMYFASVKAAFTKQYIDTGATFNPHLLAESEVFQNIRLAPGQNIEEFHAMVLEKGAKLQKTQLDILQRFVDGLPPQLAFFVRAGSPPDHQAALASAKMGEAYGYRVQPQASQSGPFPSMSTVTPSANPVPSLGTVASATAGDVPRLQDQVNRLSDVVEKLSLEQRHQFRRRPSNTTTRQQRTCFRCHAPGHIKWTCNWNGQGHPDTNRRCDRCRQFGHSTGQCRHANDPAPAAATSRPGNLISLGDTERGHPGGGQ